MPQRYVGLCLVCLFVAARSGPMEDGRQEAQESQQHSWKRGFHAETQRRREEPSLLVFSQRALRLCERLSFFVRTRSRSCAGSVLSPTWSAAQIDRLVYALYGLTEDEIRIVEKAT